MVIERLRTAPAVFMVLLLAVTVFAAGVGFAIAAVCVGWPRAPADAPEYGVTSGVYQHEAASLAAAWFARGCLLQVLISGAWLLVCRRRRKDRPMGLARATLPPVVIAALLCVGGVSYATWRSDALFLFRRDVMNPIPPSVSVHAAYGWKGPDGERRGFVVTLSPQDFDRIAAATAMRQIPPTSQEFAQDAPYYKAKAEKTSCPHGTWPPDLVELWTGSPGDRSITCWTNASHDTAYIVCERGDATEF